MNEREIDAILSSDREIDPSPRFVSAVMDAVMREASTAAAIPFPWKRAIPGAIAFVLALALVALSFVPSAGTERLAQPNEHAVLWICWLSLVACGSILAPMAVVRNRSIA